jgi:hypothetical protein
METCWCEAWVTEAGGDMDGRSGCADCGHGVEWHDPEGCTRWTRPTEYQEE